MNTCMRKRRVTVRLLSLLVFRYWRRRSIKQYAENLCI